MPTSAALFDKSAALPSTSMEPKITYTSLCAYPPTTPSLTWPVGKDKFLKMDTRKMAAAPFVGMADGSSSIYRQANLDHHGSALYCPSEGESQGQVVSG